MRKGRERTAPGRPHRSWPRLTFFEPDPKYEVLHECHRCKRKVGKGPLKALRLWKVKPVVHRRWRWPGHREGPDPSWNWASVECADATECDTWRDSKAAKEREARERRNPPLPHADAPPGSCKWCGEKIELDESCKGWKRRKGRGYHRGDEFELGDRNCSREADIWFDPKRGQQELLERQDGKCAVCGVVLAEKGELEEHNEKWEKTGRMIPYWHQAANKPYTEIDHILPVVDGGQNFIENLQIICNDPCHKEKTAHEARARAKRRALEAA